jgi:hypothetical protein
MGPIRLMDEKTQSPGHELCLSIAYPFFKWCAAILASG